MHITRLLQNTFSNASKIIDTRIHRTLMESAYTLSRFKELSIFGIGRNLQSKAKVKHNIKRIDRLFGNISLHAKRSTYYKGIIDMLVAQNHRPLIIVDWSGLTRCGEFHVLRASIPVGGRAITVWEKTYREKNYATQAAHKEFLVGLRHILPKDCRPIIITDAGFRSPWFRLVKSFGWDFIGRARHNTMCKETESSWFRVKKLYENATRTPKFLFKGFLARCNPTICNFYIYSGTKKNRVKKNLRGKKIQCSVTRGLCVKPPSMRQYLL
jgi:Transposase DDE domain